MFSAMEPYLCYDDNNNAHKFQARQRQELFSRQYVSSNVSTHVYSIILFVHDVCMGGCTTNNYV